MTNCIPTFETRRLILQGVTEDDIPAYERHFVDYEVISQLAAAVPWPYPEGGVAEWVRERLLPNQGKNRWYWGLFLKDRPDEIIGLVELFRPGVPENRGFWLGRKFWGRGLMSEALEPLTTWAFNELGFDRLVFANAVGNTRSRRIKEKAGARLVRLEPGSFVNPDYTQREIWELTRADWFEGRADPFVMTFHDHFSGHAADYAERRPGYPDELFVFLAAVAEERGRAWDCATGNGQAAIALTRHFRSVIATDASSQQIDNARCVEGVEYRMATAEASGIESETVDLITVAQALHWFKFEAFYAEARRVARPGAVIAVWCYELANVTPQVDSIIESFYRGPVAKYWPKQREQIETGYRDIPFPFDEIEPPTFDMERRWTVGTMMAYVRTWSAVQRYIQATGKDPVDDLERQLAGVWGREERRVRWPLTIKVGRVKPGLRGGTA